MPHISINYGVIDLHFAAGVWVYLHSSFLVGSVKRVFFRKGTYRPFKVIQGH